MEDRLTDAQLKEINLQPKREHKSLGLDEWTHAPLRDFANEILAKLNDIPEEYRDRAHLSYPDDFSDGFAICWYEPEPDDAFMARAVKAYRELVAKRDTYAVRLSELKGKVETLRASGTYSQLRVAIYSYASALASAKELYPDGVVPGHEG